MAVFCFQRRAGVPADGALKRRLQSVYRVHKTRREFVVTLSVSLSLSLSLSLCARRADNSGAHPWIAPARAAAPALI